MGNESAFVKPFADKMRQRIEQLKRELQTLRAGRANPQILDRITVDYYGTPTPLSQVSNISVPEPRVLAISVWDAKMLSQVEKAIQKSDLGINPNNDGKIIRLVIPELTQERRKELCKSVHKYGEETKVAVRGFRRDCNEGIKKGKKDGEFTEDDAKDLEEEIQKITDALIKDIDKVLQDKEKEIMTV